MYHNIAFVDDESVLLETLELALMNDPYNVFTYQEPLIALEQLEKHEFAVVISDLMMPEMDGATLLKEVKKRCPTVECLMMTGVMNHPEITESNIPVIYKPCDLISFRNFIKDAVTRYEDKRNTIKDTPAEAKRILFIDDDPYIKDAIQGMLNFLGYEPVVFQNSKSAFKLLKSRPESFDLVITDMNMPQMNGVELSKQLLKNGLNLPVILCTGECEHSAKKIASDAGISGVLSKPFTIKKLKAVIKEVLS